MILRILKSRLLYKILLVYLPSLYLLAFLIVDFWFWASPLTVSYFFSATDDPARNHDYHIGTSLIVYYLFSYFILTIPLKEKFAKRLLAAGVLTLIPTVIMGMEALSSGFSEAGRTTYYGTAGLLAKPVELYERGAESITTPLRKKHYFGFLRCGTPFERAEAERELGRILERMPPGKEGEITQTIANAILVERDNGICETNLRVLNEANSLDSLTVAILREAVKKNDAARTMEEFINGMIATKGQRPQG
jgi:hypothetical protein